MDKELFSNEPDISKVKITDPFWQNRMEVVRTKVLPYEWEALNDRIEGATTSHAVANFKIAADLTKNGLVGKTGKGTTRTEGAEAVDTGEGGFKGFVFQDSDIAKWLEAIAYTLTWHKDAEIEKTADEVIDLVCAAQQEDGYLDTFYIINGIDKKWTNLKDNHELYCFGHMLEAAVAYYEATGKDKLLNAMKKYADYIDRVFGPESDKKHGYPGHEEAELALVKLYRVTKEKKYLNLAKYFIDARGTEPNYFAEECKERGVKVPSKEDLAYHQAHKPVREQDVAIGHAVRAVYLYTAMADVAKITEDEELFAACERLWKDITTRQMYITGSIGSSHVGEAFTFDYDLPNDAVYGETCAAIGLAFFAKRMLGIRPKREYADVLEKVLYNGILSGISLDGTRFFYVNPLEVVPYKDKMDARFRHVKTERQKWFGCACCPPNIARIMADLGSYLSSVNGAAFYTHLPVGSETESEIAGTNVKVIVTGNYPWDGDIEVKIDPEKETAFTYGIRIPSWCDRFEAEFNGEKLNSDLKDGYLTISRTFKKGDVLKLTLSMEAKVIEADSKVRADYGKVAVMRGPVVYCLEEADNGKDLHLLSIDTDTVFGVRKESELGGIDALYADGYREITRDDDRLYRPAGAREYEHPELKFVPYYAWNNRGEGEMRVWVQRR
ncbi:MAG: glycoside hydrolase family 127 protein [Lachnospiraceae bacterium]|nr:glycoside hydrolase family 127 protein [Lachnospiraceae bacterium]